MYNRRCCLHICHAFELATLLAKQCNPCNDQQSNIVAVMLGMLLQI